MLNPEIKPETKNAPINIRAYPSDRSLIDRAAKIAKKSRVDFMMESATIAAKNVILDQTLFSISEADYAQIETILEASLTENEGYQRLMKKTSPWDTD